ncbi:MAG: hypothetical protein WCF18_13670 [Chthoniobacteraceae bacterium]
MPRACLALTLIGLCLLAAGLRAWNLRDIFVDGRIFFVDADCYSRMSRVRLVANGEALVIRHHDFENWPEGTHPHTTAPMDWSIAAAKVALDAVMRLCDPRGRSLLHAQTLDLAGAIISPLLGLAACAFVAVWSSQLKMRGALAVPLVFAISPILVHGTLLGRPDHQSLLIAGLALALAAELTLSRGLARNWGVAAGVAWAFSLWVSLYEPLIMLVVVAGFWLVQDRRRFTAPEMRPGWVVCGAVLLGAWLIDGWRVSWPDAALRAAFVNWKSTIGELAHLDPRTPLLYRWLGAGIGLAPIALASTALRARRCGESSAAPRLCLVLLAATFALTLWQLRWGYFLALVFALSLPWQFAALRRAWIAWPIFLLALWPLAQDWDEKLFAGDHPELELDTQRGLFRLEAVRLREVAERMRGTERRPFLAPWWLSPALAYWSRQPGVAGSSHESLPGIVASARFFLAPDAAEAERQARALGVKWIVTDDPDRLIATSRALLDRRTDAAAYYISHLHEIGEPRERVTAEDLRTASPEARAKLAELADRAEAAQLGSPAFSCVSSNQFYKLFSVKDAPPTP